MTDFEKAYLEAYKERTGAIAEIAGAMRGIEAGIFYSSTSPTPSISESFVVLADALASIAAQGAADE